MVMEQTAPNSADEVEVFGSKEPGGAGTTEAMIVSRKAGYLLVVIDGRVTGSEVGGYEAGAESEAKKFSRLEGHFQFVEIKRPPSPSVAQSCSGLGNARVKGGGEPGPQMAQSMNCPGTTPNLYIRLASSITASFAYCTVGLFVRT